MRARQLEIALAALDRIEGDAEAVFAKYRATVGWPAAGWPSKDHPLRGDGSPLADRDWSRLRVADLMRSRAGLIRAEIAAGDEELALALALDTLAQLPASLVLTGAEVRRAATAGGAASMRTRRAALDEAVDEAVACARELLATRPHQRWTCNHLATLVAGRLERSPGTVRRWLTPWYQREVAAREPCP